MIATNFMASLSWHTADCAYVVEQRRGERREAAEQDNAPESWSPGGLSEIRTHTSDSLWKVVVRNPLSLNRVPHAFVYDGSGPGRIFIGFTPAARIEQFFRELEKRGEYFGNASPEDKELAHRLYGIVNVGPPLKL
jgi:hypothetical protein